MTDTIYKPGEYVTRDNSKARIYASDGGGDYPIHGAIYAPHGWELQHWSMDGRICKELGNHDADLMPPKQVRYCNIYREYTEAKRFYLHESRAIADENASFANGTLDPKRIACIRIEFTEGQFDD